MISQIERTPQKRAGRLREQESAISMPSRDVLLRALNDLKIAEEFGDLSKREVDFITKYLVALFVVHHLRDVSGKHLDQLNERYLTVLREVFSD